MDYVVEGVRVTQEVSVVPACVPFKAMYERSDSGDSETELHLQAAARRKGGLSGEQMTMLTMYANLNVMKLAERHWLPLLGHAGNGMPGTLDRMGVPLTYGTFVVPRSSVSRHALPDMLKQYRPQKRKLRWGKARGATGELRLFTLCFKSVWVGGALREGLELWSHVTVTMELAHSVLDVVLLHGLHHSLGAPIAA